MERPARPAPIPSPDTNTSNSQTPGVDSLQGYCSADETTGREDNSQCSVKMFCEIRGAKSV